MSYKSSSAYDFELFMPKEKRTPKKNNIVGMPKRKQPEAKQNSHPLKGRAGAICMSVLVISLLCMMIYTRVEISETQDQIKEKEQAIEQLKSEHTRMSMQIESKMNFKSVEEAAQALGMVKKNKGSVQYVKVSEEDKVEMNGSQEQNN